MPEDKLLTVMEVAERLGLYKGSVYKMIDLGMLPAVKVGPNEGAIRVRESDLDQWIKDRACTTSPK